MKKINKLSIAAALMFSTGISANEMPESPSLESFNSIAPSFVKEKEKKDIQLSLLEKKVVMTSQSVIFPRNNEESIEARKFSYNSMLKNKDKNEDIVETALNLPSIEINYPKSFSSQKEKDLYLREVIKTLNIASEKRLDIMNNIVERELLKSDLLYGKDNYNREAKKQNLERTNVNIISANYGSEFKIGDEDQLLRMSKNDFRTTQEQVEKIMSQPKIAEAVKSSRKIINEGSKYENKEAHFINFVNIANGDKESFEDVLDRLNNRSTPVFEREKTKKIEIDYSQAIKKIEKDKKNNTNNVELKRKTKMSLKNS